MAESFGVFGATAQAPKGGAFTQLGSLTSVFTKPGNGSGISIIDNAALFGTGSDGPGDEARFGSSGAVAPGSAGAAGQLGGWQLMINFVPLSNFSGTQNVYGNCWIQQGNLLLDIGTMQQGNVNFGNAGFAVDLIQRTPDAPNQIYTPGVFLLDPSSQSISVWGSTLSTTGWVGRFTEIWMGVCNGFGSVVTSIPAPITSIGSVTTLSAATLNTSIQQTLNLLNNPPMLNCQVQNTNAITANNVTTVPFTVTPLTDNFSGYSTLTTTYTVKLPGIYFCHANIIYGIGWNAGTAIVGFQVNGTNYWSGGYNATPVASQNTGAAATKMLDLQAGDTVKVVTQTSTNSNFGNANVSHFIMAWMAPINTSTQTWVPPEVTGFQFLAATPPGNGQNQLAGLMNTKIANDLNFLLNRPYLTVHQGSAQSGLPASTSGTLAFINYSAISMTANTGLVHGSLGDNYGGYSTASSTYTAQVPGWYLAVSEINAATTATANSGSALSAGFSVPTSGGVFAPTGFGGPPDWYQTATVANSWTYPTGATAIGLYYLLAGETITPIGVKQALAGGTWGTDVSHNFLSHFSLIWLSN